METEGTRKRIITTTVELMEAQGYHATGLNQILQQSAAPKGSLYHHFPGGKEELAAEAISLAGQAITNDLDALIAEGTDLGTALSLLAAFFRERLQISHFQKGCPLATVTLEMAATSDPVQQACRAVYHAWLARLEHLLIASGCEATRAPARALFVLSTIEGALLLCRAERSTHPLEEAMDELRLLFAGDTKAR
ncbi:TetR/AcrR family transcriptional regulator [Ktedonosporobacter rubrisoli]|uniref:TetR/AcrR family transcriptional regulator n=1 Tax=Ktedonosporobacter rubrisoli TaxID=2509675 RepID=A0A4P6JJ42_KTERU|nr:TetR/AcrR family transcriptional regulator [Ktedonosporobacter rubrisoli]QBD75127.1 TetR/AcrR family transcriptional regulator [Ktedonosporobacter rubrisoli]